MQIPTSYIPTTGSAASRAQDVLSADNINWLTQGQGSFAVTGRNFGYAASGGYVFSLSDGTADNIIEYSHSWQTIILMENAGTEYLKTIQTVTAYGREYRFSLSYDDNTFNSCNNGQLYYKNSSSFIISTNFTTFNIGPNPWQNFSGSLTIKKIRYWPDTLNGADLKVLSICKWKIS